MAIYSQLSLANFFATVFIYAAFLQSYINFAWNPSCFLSEKDILHYFEIFVIIIEHLKWRRS